MPAAQTCSVFENYTVSDFASRVTNRQFTNLSSAILSSTQLNLLSRGSSYIFKPPPNPKDPVEVDKALQALSHRLEVAYFFRRREENTHDPPPPFNPKLHIPNPTWSLPDTVEERDVFQKHLADFTTLLSAQLRTSHLLAMQRPLPKSERVNYLSAKERAILRELTTSNLTFVEADKNLGLVLLDRDVYIADAERILADNFTYKPITDMDNDALMQLVLSRLHDVLADVKELLTGPCRFIQKWITAKSDVLRFGLIYLLIKIHKGLSPKKYRPICAPHSSPTHPVSVVVDALLHKYLIKIPSYCPDSLTVVRRLESVRLPLNTPITLVSFDVENLYPSIPIQDALSIISRYLKQYCGADPAWVDAVLTLLQFVLCNNFVLFNGRTWLQITGTAMGTPAAVVFACLFLAALEHEWYLNNKQRFALYQRFIDDGMAIVLANESDARQLVSEYNSFHTNIKITSTFSPISTIFLDLEIYRDPNDPTRLNTRIYQKPMNKFLYIQYNSYHHTHVKQGFIRGELIRYIRNTTVEHDFLVTRKQFFDRLQARGYPTHFLLPIFESIHFSQRASLLTPTPIQANPRAVLALTRSIAHDNISLGRVVSRAWFDVLLPDPSPADDIPTATAQSWLRSQPKPLIATKYPSNLHQLLVRADVNAFHRAPPAPSPQQPQVPG